MMKEDFNRKIAYLLKFLLFLTSCLWFCVFATVVWLRFGFPFNIEWVEGAVVDAVSRILEGKQLYVQPSVEYIPFLYNPLYLYISAAVAKITGIGFAPLRAVSVISILGCFYIIYRLVRRETGGVYWGAVSAFFFCATYGITGFWFDLIKVDSTFLFFLLAGTYVLRFASSPGALIASGVLFFLAFLTKQSAIPVIAALCVFSVMAHGRRALYFILTVSLLSFASVMVLNYASEGWYVYLAFVLPGGHGIVTSQILDFWTNDLLYNLAPVVLFSLYFMVCLREKDRLSFWFYTFALAGFGASSYMMRIHFGGNLNSLIPVYAILSVTFGAGVHEAISRLKHRKFAETAIYMICIIQFAWIGYNPMKEIPTEQNLRAGYALLELFSSYAGDVFAPDHGFIPTFVNKKTFAHQQTIADLFNSKENRGLIALQQSLDRAFIEKKFSAVILSDKNLMPNYYFNMYYKLEKIRNVDNPHEMVNVSGLRTEARYVFIPK